MKRENNTIILDTRYDSSNALEMEQELFSLLQPGEQTITLNACNLGYISSAGLRVLMKLRKKVPDVNLIEVSRDVYDVLEMTGFSSLMNIQRALRNVSLENAVEIGHGLSSVVYRLDKDTVIKVYNPRIPLEKIRKECDNVKKAFFFGIPASIGFDIVKAGSQYGAVLELVEGEVLSSYMNDHPDRFEEYSEKYISLLKESTSTEVDDTFADVKQLWNIWIDNLAPFLEGNELEIMHALVNAVPERRTFIHSDIHANNIMTRDGSLILIDMADIGRGHPIFDVCALCFHYIYLEEADRFMADTLVVLNYENRHRLWANIEEEFLADPDPVRHAALVEIYRCMGALRCGLIAAKQAQMEDSKKARFVAVMRKYLFPKAEEVLSLMKQYL